MINNPQFMVAYMGNMTREGDHVTEESGQTDSQPDDNSTKEASDDGLDTCRGLLVDMLAIANQIRVAHWKASTKTNEHKALGDLYGSVSDFTDSFAEVLMGRTGSREMPELTKPEGSMDPKDLISKLRDISGKLVSCTKKAGAEELLNMTADLLATVNKTAYLLQE